ncbi:MAD2L1-binding protein-like [Cylas formicarius]|uniref:MAD2L1-binding protein-like n=1 Tax=Cylas formicarius TaxID=197179 RepID=UPI00295868C3|nr:MAD2L1-binding protein-like [Cylas formicarius]
MIDFQVNVSDVVFTPFACAALIYEIVKGLLFQKNQIPYPYERLKDMVEKRRKKQNGITLRNYAIETHYRNVSLVYDNLEKINNWIIRDFSKPNSVIKEVLVVFGDTPHCAREVFTISVCALDRGHIERNHLKELRKYLQRILRNIFLSEDFLEAVDASMNCTNVFLYMKKCCSGKLDMHSEDLFESCLPLAIPAKAKQMKINITNDMNKFSNCCKDLSVFSEDREEVEKHLECKVTMEDGQTEWYKCKFAIKGFKDCFIDKVSACELW